MVEDKKDITSLDISKYSGNQPSKPAKAPE